MTTEDRSAQTISVVYIEDDDRIARLMAKYLESHGVAVTLAADGPSGIAAVKRERPSVVLLDLMLPGIDGIEVCRQIRAHAAMPIIMVTARGEEADRVMGLEGGADDYVVKPYNSREILARVRAQHRRAMGKVGPVASRIDVAGISVDTRAMRASLNGKALALTTYEFTLLRALAERAGFVLSREQLVEIVRGSPEEAFERSVDVHVSHLRQKLNDDPRKPSRLKTVRGVGYVLVSEPEEE
jgi:DNA-binding response OmpR family regulator